MSEVPRVDFALDRFELLVLRVGPKADAIHPDVVQKLQAEHVAYLFGLQSSGRLLAAGAVAPRAPGQDITGLGFFALGSVDEVRRLAEKDPSVVAGLDAVDVLTFLCPKGSLGFPNAAR